jgi:hypothetical protein
MGQTTRQTQDVLFRPQLIVIYLAIIALLSIPTRTPLLWVFLGTTPLFFQIVILAFVDPLKKSHLYLLMTTPFFFSTVFYLLATTNAETSLSQMDAGSLFTFNLISSILIILYARYLQIRRKERAMRQHKKQTRPQPIPKAVPKSEPEIRYKETIRDISEDTKQQYESTIELLSEQLKEAQHQLSMSEQEVSQTLQSIEDKCKGINFVIGRVYADKKGGSKEIRDQLKIPRELYNAFSDRVTDLNNDSKKAFLDILHKLYYHLQMLESEEKAFFTPTESDLPIQRKDNGSSRIIDVLADNDKDPVRDYHTQAKETCTQLIEFLGQDD